MALKKIGKFNHIPDNLLPKLPPKGTIAKFRILKKAKDPIADKGRPVEAFPASDRIPVQSSFAYKNAEGEIVWVDISLLQSVNKDTDMPVYPVQARKGSYWNPAERNGILNIVIGSSQYADDQFQFLMLASFVAGNAVEPEMKDSNVTPKYEYIDEAAEAKVKMDARKQKMDAQAAVLTLNEKALFEVALRFDVDVKVGSQFRDLDVIKSDLYTLAEAKPAFFLQVINDPDSAAIARVSAALLTGVLYIDHENKTLNATEGKDVILKLDGTDKESVQAQYVEWLKNPASKLVNEKIKKEIEKKFTQLK